jgi:hypothetical protein
MPDERMRAVGWGGELLEQIASDTALPDTMIAAAKRIALTYPTSQALEEWLLSGAEGLPPEWTTAFVDALALFDEMRIGAHGSARTRSDLMYTLRHFPDQMTIRTMSRTSRLHEWVQQPVERERPANPPSPVPQAHFGIAGRAVLTDSLDDALAVIRAAALLSCDLKKATSWYFADNIDVFDGSTAEALVLRGRARDVLRYIESLQAGASG